ncbi:hypothetical protein ACN28E_45475 [Archangium lansingense]|uniref:hypothetical protein n=1 Tax=Archangium lansingense TaxID=2995310 RepID=UPI003B7AE83F
MREVFDHLQSVGIIRNNEIVFEKLEKMPFAQLLDLIQFVGGVGLTEALPANPGPFSFSASLTLSGGPTECGSAKCRLERVDEMSRFALLFSDCVYVRNPFADLLPGYLHEPLVDSPDLRMRIAGDFLVFLRMQPLLESGVVAFFATPANRCLACFARDQLSPDTARRISRAYRKLSKRYSEELEARAVRIAGGDSFRVSGPEFLLEHGGQNFLSFSRHPVLTGMPKIQKRLEAGEEVKLSKSTWKRIGLHRRFPDLVAQNVQYHLAVSQALNASFLTHSELHISFLKDALGSPELEERNRVVTKHLTAAIPFLHSVPVPKLLELRRKEQDAFLMFRSSVLEAANEVRGSSVGFTENHARQLYGDVLQPGLARLEERVRAARREPLLAAAKSAAGVSLALSFGLYFGLIPAELQAALNALGVLKVAGDVAAKAGDAVSPARAIRSESLYFLWRAKRLVSGR